jgi:hypothetical protein
MPSSGIDLEGDSVLIGNRIEGNMSGSYAAQPKMRLVQEIKTVSSRYTRQWRYPTGKEDGYYTVSGRPDGEFECSCLGWTRHTPRRDCKHIAGLKVMIKSGTFIIPPREGGVATDNVRDKESDPSSWRIPDDESDPLCTKCDLLMEPNWGFWRCPKCGLTVGEEAYFVELQKHKPPELSYPV